MTRRLLLAGIIGAALIASGPASAKGQVVAFGISGGEMPSEVRVAADNDDLVYGVEPLRGRTSTPYRLTLYMWLATYPQQERAVRTYELYAPQDGWPAQLRDVENDQWLGLRNEAAARVETVLATVVPASPTREARTDAPSAPAPAAGTIAAVVVLMVAAFARRTAIRSGRRRARAGPV